MQIFISFSESTEIPNQYKWVKNKGEIYINHSLWLNIKEFKKVLKVLRPNKRSCVQVSRPTLRYLPDPNIKTYNSISISSAKI